MAERKRFLEIVLMPLVLAIVGALGTYLITEQQREASEAAAEAQRQATAARAAADRQLKILDIFADKITSPNENERILAIYSTLALDPDLASKLLPAFLVAREGPEAGVAGAAGSLADAQRASSGEGQQNDGKEKQLSRYSAILSSVTEAIVLSRVSVPDSDSAFEGTWLLLNSDKLEPDFENPLSMELSDSGELVVKGINWRGRGKVDGRWGYYDWVFDNNPQRVGRTRIYLNEAGLIYGHVKGSDLNWTYWGYQVTQGAPVQRK